MAQNQPTGYFDPQTGAFVPFAKKKKKKWPWIVAAVLLVAIIGAGAGGNKSEPAEKEKAAPKTEAAEAEAKTGAEPAETQAGPTAEELRADYIASCAVVEYEQIMRRPDDYKGRPVTATGEVVQILEETHLFTGTSVNIRLEDENGDVWLLAYNKSEVETPNGNVLEGDRLTIYGDCTGTTSYKSLIGKQITVPTVSVRYMVEAAP